MQLPLQGFASLLQTMAAGVQGAATELLDLTVGSVLRAILEANAAIALWMQWLIVQVLGVTRAATSSGADLDSFVDDFGLARLPASAAGGSVALSRLTPTLAAFIPPGTQIRSSDYSQSFGVIADPTNPAWNAILGGYQLAAGIATLQLRVSAAMAGAAGNVLAGTATVLGTAIAGVDAVTNPLAFAGGLDAESDAALRTRFAGFMRSRAQGTVSAIVSAVAAVQQGLSVVVSENADPTGNPAPGQFLVTLDDGSGNPPAALLAQAYAAVDAVRPVGALFSVRAPAVTTATVSLALTVPAGANRAAIDAVVAGAISTYIDALPIGTTLAWSRLAQVAYDASPLIGNVTSVLLNGGTQDLAVPVFGVVKASAVVAS